MDGLCCGSNGPVGRWPPDRWGSAVSTELALVLALFTGCSRRDITYKCCLPHDLCYACGEPGNHAERKRVDAKFFSDLVTKAGMKTWLAHAFLAGVRVGGPEELGLSFSWGFARK